MASDITFKGASIHDFLGKEFTLRGQRSQILQRNYEIANVEATLQNKMQNMEITIRDTQVAINNIASTEATLDQKIERKTAELQRLRKRLETMKNIR